MDTDEAHLEYRATEKRRAVSALGRALLKVERDGREPDDWELACLAQGLAALFNGIYVLASCEASHAMALPEERNPHYTSSDVADLKGLTLEILKQALAEAAAEPVRQFPHFGRIVVTGS